MPLCGDVVTLDLEGDAEVEPGDLISAANDPVESEDEFQVRLICDGRQTLSETADWQLCLGPAQRLRRVHVQELRADEQDPGRGLLARLRLDAPVAFEPSPALGPLRMFSLHEATSGRSVAGGHAGVALPGGVQHPPPGRQHRQAGPRRLKGQRPCVLWFTGLSGAGKTPSPTSSSSACTRWASTPICSMATTCATGSTVTSASATRRAENIRRVAEVAKLMVDAGLIVLTAFISPFPPSATWRATCWPRRVRRGLWTPRWRGRAARREGPPQARRGELKGLHRHRRAPTGARAPPSCGDASRGTADMADRCRVVCCWRAACWGDVPRQRLRRHRQRDAAFAPVLHASVSPSAARLIRVHQRVQLHGAAPPTRVASSLKRPRAL